MIFLWIMRMIIVQTHTPQNHPYQTFTMTFSLLLSSVSFLFYYCYLVMCMLGEYRHMSVISLVSEKDTASPHGYNTRPHLLKGPTFSSIAILRPDSQPPPLGGHTDAILNPRRHYRDCLTGSPWTHVSISISNPTECITPR